MIKIDNHCASCSGHNQHVIKLLKVACLHYQPQNINVRGKLIDRMKLI
jgi:hypothetical protein